MNDILISITILILLIYGLYMLVWPEKALELFMSQHDLMSPRWHKTKTGKGEGPPVGLFQLAGVFLVILSLCLVYGLIR